MNKRIRTVSGLLGAVLALALVALPARAADTVVYYHTDALHSVSVVTDAQGQVLERTRYAPYGQVLNRPLRDGPGYTGHREDAATGLVYMQQRYYDPEVGRFLSVDPVEADAETGGNFSRYWYANDNPYRFADPDGRAACPKGSGGMCIDSPNTETGKTVQAGPTRRQQAVDSQVRVASRTKALSDGTKLNFNRQEQGFKASDSGTTSNPMVLICQHCVDGSTREGGVFNVRALGPDESGGHTHTNRLSGLPGPEDGTLARATGRSAYVISERGAFGVEKTDVGYRIRVIDGVRPTNRERAQMRATIDGWNQHQGGSGVSCTVVYGSC